MRLYPTISPYVGAKALLAAELARLFYYRNVKEYYSLFTGMANDIIQAPLHGMKIHANDWDKGVYCLLKVLCDPEKNKALYYSMFDLEYSKKTFIEAKEKVANREKLMLFLPSYFFQKLPGLPVHEMTGIMSIKTESKMTSLL